jgi:Domain of unknown function (DUF4349)
MGGTRRRSAALIGATLIAAVALGGCGSPSSDNASSGSAADPAMAKPEIGTQAGGAAPAEGKDQAAKAPDLSVDQRSIIYTGSITVRVEDVNQAAAKATAIANGAGGFVGGDKRNTSDGSSDATLELRVPAEKFSAVVDQLSRDLGKEEQRGISTEDVTEQTIDLDARIAVQQARVDSGRRLLGQAKSLNDLVMLEREVATRESDLASLQAKKRRLSDLTTLSTITLVLLDPQAVKEVDDGPPGFLSGLSGGWDALVSSLAVLLTVIGALLPWLIALGIPLWLIFYLLRRFGRRRARSDVEPVPAFAGTGGLFPYRDRPEGPVGQPDSAPPASSDAPAKEED